MRDLITRSQYWLEDVMSNRQPGMDDTIRLVGDLAEEVVLLRVRLEEALLNKIPHYVVIPNDPIYEAKVDVQLAPQIRGSRPVVKSRSPEEIKKEIQSLRDERLEQDEASRAYPYRKGDL